ncbi:MFS general substrate transporter [Daldinia bambusicola]|nr:MFS general substrate transporter [Daldinia bambusicola]
MRALRWRRAGNRSQGNGNGSAQSSFTRVLIRPSDCGEGMPTRWAEADKQKVLWVIFAVQVSMNLNTTLYSSGLDGIAHEFSVTTFQVRWGGAASFLVAYAFGCELWAPWSEEYGRREVLQASLLFVNIFALVTGLSTTWYGHIIGRTLGGLSSAGGSVTLALISDMYDPHTPEHQYATAFIVLSSVGGSLLGPIFGGFIEVYLPWRWVIWIQLIFGIFVQALHFLLVPETRATIVMDRIAKEKRKADQSCRLYGPTEMAGKRSLKWSEILVIWFRPFKMFFTEPIVLVFSLLSGFSDALIFMMVQSYGLVYWQWGFGPLLIGCAFIPIGIGYLIGFCLAHYFIGRQILLRQQKPYCERAQYEARLFWLIFTAPLLPLGLLIFAFGTSFTHTPVHWIFSMIGACMIGIANYAIYMGTIDYVLRAYGPYAASATGGNGWARDFLAGVLTPYAVPMMGIFKSTMILSSIASFLFACLLLIYRFGPRLRGWSKFAQTLAEAEAEAEIGADTDDVSDGSENPFPLPPPPHVDRMVHFLPSDSLPGSRAGSRFASANNSPAGTRPSSLDLEHLARSSAHGSQLGQHSQAKPVSAAAGRSINVSPVPEAVSSDDVSKTCTNCSGPTLAGTCNQCSQKSTRAPNSENESPPTSLREVENAEANATPETFPVIPAPAENQTVELPPRQEKPRKRRHSGTCRMM